VRVSIYDRKTKRGTLEFFLAAYVDEKVIALKHVDFSFMPDLKMEDVAEELQRFVRMFKDEILEALVVDKTEDWASTESGDNRKNLRQ
jgi:hypothetical protein